MNNNRMTARRLAELSMLTAAALIIFVIELGIPALSPVPGVKLGLANIITVYCVYRYPAFEAALVTAVRVVLGSFFAASFSTILFSAAGAALCLAGMIPLARFFPRLPVWLCSIIGAVLHNIGQLAAASVYLGSVSVFLYFPVLLVSGVIAGAFTGLCAWFVIKRLGNR